VFIVIVIVVYFVIDSVRKFWIYPRILDRMWRDRQTDRQKTDSHISSPYNVITMGQFYSHVAPFRNTMYIWSYCTWESPTSSEVRYKQLSIAVPHH